MYVQSQEIDGKSLHLSFNFVMNWKLLLKKKSFFFDFLGPHPQHMVVPRLGVESELQLPAYTTATATLYWSYIWDLHHGSQQGWIPNPLCEARDWTHFLMDISQVRFRCTTMGTPLSNLKW